MKKILKKTLKILKNSLDFVTQINIMCVQNKKDNL